MTAPRVVVVGDVINDIVAVTRGDARPEDGASATVRARPGGSAANIAVWLGSRGVPVDFVGAVGAHDAALHESEFREAGVEPHLSVEVSAPTGTIIILVHGTERSTFADRGANTLLTPDAVTDELLAGAALLHIGGYRIADGFGGAGGRSLFARAAAAGVPVSVNSASVGMISQLGAEAFLEAIAGAELLFVGAEESALLTGLADPDAAARLLGASFPVVVLTRGEHGALVVADGADPVAIAAHPVRSVDPTGAGDAFLAGFVEVWLRTRDAIAAAEAGAFLAARAVMVIGGRPPV